MGVVRGNFSVSTVMADGDDDDAGALPENGSLMRSRKPSRLGGLGGSASLPCSCWGGWDEGGFSDCWRDVRVEELEAGCLDAESPVEGAVLLLASGTVVNTGEPLGGRFDCAGGRGRSGAGAEAFRFFEEARRRDRSSASSAAKLWGAGDEGASKGAHAGGGTLPPGDGGSAPAIGETVLPSIAFSSLYWCSLTGDTSAGSPAVELLRGGGGFCGIGGSGLRGGAVASASASGLGANNGGGGGLGLSWASGCFPRPWLARGRSMEARSLS